MGVKFIQTNPLKKESLKGFNKWFSKMAYYHFFRWIFQMTKKVNFSSLSLIKTLQGDIKKKKLIVKLCFKNIILVM